MGEKRNAFKVSVGKPYGQRPLGRDVDEKIMVIESKKERRPLVNIQMNLLIRKRHGISLLFERFF
jgi:hypothetical protein